MKLYGDYHTHTRYSHGTGSVMDNARAARERGLKELAITDHGFNHIFFNLRRKKLPALIADVEAARRETGVRVLTGVESNLIGEDGSIDVTAHDREFLDIILCGFHKGVRQNGFRDTLAYWRAKTDAFFGGSARQIQRNTDMYLRAIERNPIDVITHINYGVRVDLPRVARQCADFGTYLELNGKRVSATAGNFTRGDFEAMLETGVGFILNSDAHSPGKVGNIEGPAAFLEGIEVPSGRIVNIGDAPPPFRSVRERNGK